MEFVSAGAKNYAFKCSDGSSTCKIKGFTLHHKNGLLLNFDVMKKMVLQHQRGGDCEKVITVNSKICRDDKNSKLYNRSEAKKYGLSFSKRILLEDMSSIPFGFRYHPSEMRPLTAQDLT